MEYGLFKSVGDIVGKTATGIGDAMSGAIVNGIPRIIDAEIDRKIKVTDPATVQKKVSDVTGQVQQAGTIAPPAGITQKQAIMYGGAALAVVVVLILVMRK